MRTLTIAFTLGLLAMPAAAGPIEFCGQSIDDKTVELECKDKSVSDLSPLAGATALEDIDLRLTAVADLTPLAGLTKLAKLDVRGTPVTNLAPLAKLPLVQLNLSGTKV